MNKTAKKMIAGFMTIALAFVIMTSNGPLKPGTYKDPPKGNNYLGYAYAETTLQKP